MGVSTRGVSLPAVALAMLGVAACADPGERPPAPSGELIPAGTRLGDAVIAGRVVSRRAAPRAEPIAMNSDAWCHGSHAEPPRTEDFVVADDGGLQDAFVRIAAGFDRRFAPPQAAVTLDQRGCVYHPRVVGMQVGQALRILNSDATLHNVHTASRENPAFNFGMTLQGQEATRYFHHEEVMVPVRCNVHPWMTGFIGVVWHPYFDITDSGGRFTMRDLPPGRYEIEAWHERLGAIRSAVTLEAGETKEVTLEYPP